MDDTINQDPNEVLKGAQENFQEIPGDARPQSGLTSDDIDSVQDIKMVQPAPQTAAVGLQGDIEAGLAEVERVRTEKAKSAQTQKDNSLEAITSFLQDTPGETERTATAEREAGIPKIQVELDDINDQIRREQLALRRQIERVQTEAGLTKGQVNAQVSELERKSLSKQADLSIIQQGVQGRFDSAKRIADQKVDILMEQDERNLQALTLTFNENKEMFTKAEERAFEASKTKMQNEIDTKRETLNQINNLSLNALKNGAPTALASKMQQAKTVKEVMEIGGQYIDRYERLAQEATIANIYDQIRARKQAIADEKKKGMKESAAKEAEKEAETEAAFTNLGFISTIKTHPGFKGAVGASLSKSTRGVFNAVPFISVDTKEALPGTDKANFIAAHNQFVNSLTLDNLDLMKGVLSETDVKILSSAATRLNLGLSEKEYLKEIDLIEKTFERAIKKNGITDEQAEFYFGIPAEDINEVDSIYGDSSTPATFSPSNYY